MSSARIARLTEADWQLFAIVRLRALTDSLGVDDPQYRRESAFTAAQWRRRLRDHTHFLALIDDRPVGVIGAQQQHADTAYLYSLWLDPAARGHGLARQLVTAAVDWARGQHIRTITLRVAEDNAVARAIYESLGFSEAATETHTAPNEVAMSLDV